MNSNRIISFFLALALGSTIAIERKEINPETELEELLDAARDNNIDLMQKLINRKVNINGKWGPDGITPLIVASRNNNPRAIDLLLKTPGININETSTEDGDTPLTVAIMFTLQTEAIDKLLADPRININLKNKAGESALILAGRRALDAKTQKVLKQLLTHSFFKPEELTTPPQNRSSYLNLLPSDVIRMQKKYTYSIGEKEVKEALNDSEIGKEVKEFIRKIFIEREL